MNAQLRPIHPFPARMAPSIIWEELPLVGVHADRRLRVLDPMSGSGTTIATARMLGHTAIGLDTDPLAVLIARAWAADVDPIRLSEQGVSILERARKRSRGIRIADAYPSGADEETKEFVRYWFDPTARRQLTALAQTIAALRDTHTQTLLWCALSRLIIVKSRGVSRAMDVAHSRPHRVYERAPVRPFDVFLRALGVITRNAPFAGNSREVPLQTARVDLADARRMPLPTASVDVVISSPPYLNAIDYLRGHKFSLIWMGHRLADLRGVRATNVGTEVSRAENSAEPPQLERALASMGEVDRLSGRDVGMLRRFVWDMNSVMAEVSRVLVPSGRVVLVIGDSTLSRVFVMNSEALAVLGESHGMVTIAKRRRHLPSNRRYLPPPGGNGTGSALEGRMRDEVILSMRKVG